MTLNIGRALRDAPAWLCVAVDTLVFIVVFLVVFFVSHALFRLVGGAA